MKQSKGIRTGRFVGAVVLCVVTTLALRCQELLWKKDIAASTAFQPNPNPIRLPQVFFLEREKLVIRSPLARLPNLDLTSERSLLAVVAGENGEVLKTRIDESAIRNGDVQIAPTVEGNILELATDGLRLLGPDLTMLRSRQNEMASLGRLRLIFSPSRRFAAVTPGSTRGGFSLTWVDTTDLNSVSTLQISNFNSVSISDQAAIAGDDLLQYRFSLVSQKGTDAVCPRSHLCRFLDNDHLITSDDSTIRITTLDGAVPYEVKAQTTLSSVSAARNASILAYDDGRFETHGHLKSQPSGYEADIHIVNWKENREISRIKLHWGWSGDVLSKHFVLALSDDGHHLAVFDGISLWMYALP